jgi:putative nucleotidyltransferase with HDIG domain
MDTSPILLPAALRQLPPLPQVLVRALELIQDPRSRRSELAHVLSLDQGMTGLFLRLVNSAYYGLPRRIASLDEAIGYLGYETVQEVIFAASASKILSRAVPAYRLERTMLWRHSVAVAAGSERVAQRRLITPRSEVYVAGLLHDVGKLAIDLMVRHQAEWASKPEQDPEKTAWTEVERQITGHDHAEVGAVIVRSWNLPDRVIEAVACHHSPAQAQIDLRFTSAVHIANAAALMAGIGIGVDGLRYKLDEIAIRQLDWTESDMASLIADMQNAVAQAEEIIGLGI